MLGQLDIYVQKNVFGPYLTLFTKINSKWIKDLNMKAKTIKLLERNVDINLHVPGLDNGFLGRKPKAQAIKEKINKLDLTKSKTCFNIYYQGSEKTTYRMGGKKSADHMSDKGLLLRIYKGLNSIIKRHNPI